MQEKKFLYVTGDPAHRETHEVFCFKEETKEEWKECMEDVNKMIEKNNCYIKKTDKLVKYEFYDKRKI